ncbi:MAG: RagB/SusD family nutrient uptake outer membrane protein [Bacteroides sp.]|nr:RagB/SusD family nutrient uptake outer membrane protein [Bacteroides sp.]
MKKIYRLVLLVAGVLSLGSCELDEVNPNNSGQLSDGSYTLETYKGFVNSCYTALINNIYQSSDYLVCTEAGTDIWEEPKSGSSYQRYHSYDGMRTDDSYYYKVWQYSYQCINSCNIVIDEAENVAGSSEEIKECVAQARCLRAYYYMTLVEQFGNVDLQLKEADSENISFEAHRSTVPEIYAAIIEDLKFAVENLPVTFSDYYSRVTKKSAMGLLARAYINGAGHDLTDADGVSYLEKAYETATNMINNQAMYGWYMYPSFADVFNENNNRNNKEALFIAAGAERNTDAYTNGNYSQSEMFRHFLPSLGSYTDLGLVDKTSNFIYGRPNSNIFLPSKYLMDCFSDDMNDTRYRYSFISAFSTYSIPSWGETYEYAGSACAKEITDKLCTKFGIPTSNIGKTVYPHFNLESNSTSDANFCQLAIWNADGSAKTVQDNTGGNILHPAIPLDPVEGQQYAIYCSLKTLTEEEKAQYPGLVLNVYDLYDENGTARTTYDKPSTGSTLWLSMYPTLSKYNMPGYKFVGENVQKKNY